MDQRMVGGTMEADFQFPWVINVSGTLTGKGVLIARAGSDPRTCGRDQLQWRSHLLQTGPAAVAQTGTIASISRTQTLPPGKVAVWRGPVILNGPKTFIAKSPTASLCQGDRGSGFISSIGSANVVAGIASQAHTGDCTQPNLEFTAVDVGTSIGSGQ